VRFIKITLNVSLRNKIITVTIAIYLITIYNLVFCLILCGGLILV